MRLRPMALAVAVPVVVAAAGAGFGWHAHQSSTPVAAKDAPPSPVKQATPSAQSPSPRSQAAFTWDAAHHVDLLFGGYSQTGNAGDTWTWDGSQWHQLHPATSPPPLVGPVAAFDPGLGAVVLMGRMATNGTLSGGIPPDLDVQTWTWDGAAWHRLTAASIPLEEATGPFQLAYDARRRQLIAAGEGQASPLRDASGQFSPPASVPLHTFALQGGAWEMVDDGGIEVAARNSFAMAWDSATGAVRLVQAGARPTDPCGTAGNPHAPGFPAVDTPSPTPRPAPPPGVTCRANGGFTYTCTARMCPPAHQWAWTGTGWRAQPDAPYVGDLATLAGDPTGSGLLRPAGSLVYRWDGHAWTSRRSAGDPVRSGTVVAPDLDRHTLVAFGGRGIDDPAANPAKTRISNQTWTWDGAAWTGHGGGAVLLPIPTPEPVPPVHSGAANCDSPAPAPAVTQHLSGGMLDITVVALIVSAVSPDGRASCAAAHSFDVQLQDGRGTALAVQGNSMHEESMTPRFGIHWTNWCGSGPVFLSLRPRQGGGVTVPLQPPPCTAKGQPSALTVVDPGS